MASTTTSTISALGGKLVADLSVSASDQEVNNNVTSGTSGSIYLVEINNPGSNALYVKIRDASSATPSTSTANGNGTPHMMLYCPARGKTSYAIPGGFAYSSGLSFWASTVATVGSTASPTTACTVRIACS
tara:strand:+ start:479 stop:871 length:393 start_codon:yes stop_codon:yes gene_type:complete